MSEDGDLQGRAKQIEQLVRQVEDITEPQARNAALELVRAIMRLHADALERLTELLVDRHPEALASLARDPLISGLLLLYGLHPEPLAERVTRALNTLRRHAQGLNADVELIGITDCAIRVRLKPGRVCGTAALRQMVEDAILEAAPDASELMVEEEHASTASSQLVQLRGVTTTT